MLFKTVDEKQVIDFSNKNTYISHVKPLLYKNNIKRVKYVFGYDNYGDIVRVGVPDENGTILTKQDPKFGLGFVYEKDTKTMYMLWTCTYEDSAVIDQYSKQTAREKMTAQYIDITQNKYINTDDTEYLNLPFSITDDYIEFHLKKAYKKFKINEPINIKYIGIHLDDDNKTTYHICNKQN